MNYLKLFEYFDDSEQLYRVVDQNSFYKECRKRKSETFTKGEFSEINSIINGDQSKYKFSLLLFYSEDKSESISTPSSIIIGKYSPKNSLTSSYHKDGIQRPHRYTLEIFKTDDSWFFINVNFGTYYVCDDFDGLIQALKKFAYKTEYKFRNVLENQGERLPRRVSKKELIDRRKYGFEQFSPNEVNKIREILKRKGKTYSLSSDMLEIDGIYTNYEILKLSDYYFTIVVSHRNHGWTGSDDCYICDEFEELENFMNKSL